MPYHVLNQIRLCGYRSNQHNLMRNLHEKSLYTQRCNNDEADLILYVTTSRKLAKLIK